jgi:hypothetical protein
MVGDWYAVGEGAAPQDGGFLFRFSVCKVKVHPCTGTESLYRPYGP